MSYRVPWWYGVHSGVLKSVLVNSELMRRALSAVFRAAPRIA